LYYYLNIIPPQLLRMFSYLRLYRVERQA
jgi:hypothetical protein